MSISTIDLPPTDRMDAYEAAVDAEEKAKARLQAAVRAEESARQVLMRARYLCPREEAAYAARVAETKKAAKDAVAATYAAAEEQDRDLRPAPKPPAKKNWASVVSGQPLKPNAETWQDKEEAKRKAEEAKAKKRAEEAAAKRELAELLRWAEQQSEGGCAAHDRLGCPQCEFERSGRCYSELEENYGGRDW